MCFYCRYGLKSGLFYEDEVEITGIRHNHLDGRKPSLLVGRLNEPNRGQHQQGNTDASSLDGISPDLLILLQEQLTSLYPSCAVLRNYKSQSNCLEPKQIQEWSSFLDMRGRRLMSALFKSRISKSCIGFGIARSFFTSRSLNGRGQTLQF